LDVAFSLGRDRAVGRRIEGRDQGGDRRRKASVLNWFNNLLNIEVLMYFWDTGKLASDLKHARVSERDKMLYMLGGRLLITMSIYEALFQKPKSASWELYELLVACIIVYLGTMICYAANGKEKGENFVEKFICLSFPLAVKFTLITWCIGMVLLDITAPWFMEFYPMISFFLSMLLSYIFFWRMAWYLSKITSYS
jgi:hypothetical protein